MKTRIAVISIALVLLLTVAFAADTQEIRIGTSNVCITVPADYQKGEMAIDETNYGMVAYYYSESDLLDFDLYYWAKATGETLEAAVAEETENEYTTVEFGGVTFVCYDDVEEDAEESYATRTYIAEDGEYFVEIVFWMDGEGAEEKVTAIMDTVAIKENAGKTGEGLIRLGTSDLYITAAGYEKGEITREDTDEAMVAYYFNENSLVDFDIYYWAKATDETLESNAAAEQEEYGAEILDREINGIAAKYYFAEAEESVDGSFPTATYIIEDGEYLVEIVFWMDGETAADEVEAIISTLSF